MNSDRECMAKRLSLAFLLIAIGLFTYSASAKFNPDTDALWLIETGRYVAENGIPKDNPWVYRDDVGIIIQQPLCALINFLWWSRTGLSGMWQLASIENMVLVFAMIFYIRQFSEEKTKLFLTVALMELVVSMSGIGSTRPYQLTIANILLLVSALEKSRKKDSFGLVILSTIACTLFQTNYQMASDLIIPCFLSAYAIGGAINRLKAHLPLRSSRMALWIADYVVWFTVSLLNPYGIRGLFYLPLSKNAMSLVGDQIIEMTKPQMLSLTGILMLVVISCFLIRYNRARELDWCEIFLITGASIASMMAVRNMWMLIIVFCMSYAKKKPSVDRETFPRVIEKLKIVVVRIFNEVLHRPININLNESEPKPCSPFTRILCHGVMTASIFMFAFVVCLGNSFASKNVESYSHLFSLLDSIPNDAKVYSSFNTGAYLEYSGRKIYVDARPELYSEEIAVAGNILNEWYSLEWKDMNFAEYVKSSDWDYYFVTKNTPISFYLTYSGVANLVGEERDQQLFAIKQ